MCRYLFRATEQEKQSIADNIVGFTNGTGNLSKEAYSFVLNWILTGPNEKTKGAALNFCRQTPENTGSFIKVCSQHTKTLIKV